MPQMIDLVTEAMRTGDARKVLAALREPTRDMIAAGVWAMRHSSRDDLHDDTTLEAAYRAMIDKALGHALREQNL